MYGEAQGVVEGELSLEKTKVIVGRRFGKTSLVFSVLCKNAIEARTDLTQKEKEELYKKCMAQYERALRGEDNV